MAALLARARRVGVLAAGKAAARMLAGYESRAPRPWDAALVVAPVSPDTVRPSLEWVVGGHPLPDAGSVDAGRRALALARSLSGDDVLLVLLSGGASSLMALPAPGLSFEDKRETVSRLLTSGADITDLNTVRKHLSGIKGGRLAASTPAHVVTLAASDVVGDEVSTIGSGPAVADPTTFEMAREVVRRHAPDAPEAVRRWLDAGARAEIEETPKQFPRDRVLAQVVASRRGAMEAAATAAAARGYRVHQIETPVTGEARTAGPQLLETALQLARNEGPACIVAGGETVVRVQGGGRGGRNQEMVLAMVPALAHVGDVVVASVGTDGVDGPTDAAGARVDGSSAARAASAGLDPGALLDDNDSYRFFETLGDLIRTGPTGSNAGDIQIVIIDSSSAGTPR